MLRVVDGAKATCKTCAARVAESQVSANGVVLAQLLFNVLAGVAIEGEHAMCVTTVGKIPLCAADRVNGEPADGADVR
jgi:hypothetical protein